VLIFLAVESLGGCFVFRDVSQIRTSVLERCVFTLLLAGNDAPDRSRSRLYVDTKWYLLRGLQQYRVATASVYIIPPTWPLTKPRTTTRYIEKEDNNLSSGAIAGVDLNVTLYHNEEVMRSLKLSAMSL
jgi:hypothetical protein